MAEVWLAIIGLALLLIGLCVRLHRAEQRLAEVAEKHNALVEYTFHIAERYNGHIDYFHGSGRPDGELPGDEWRRGIRPDGESVDGGGN